MAKSGLNQIDTNALLKLSDGDEDFVIEILSLFIERTPEELNQIRKFRKSKDVEELSRIFHKLKSATTLLGVGGMREDLSRLEKVIKTHELAHLQADIDQVLLDLDRLVENAILQLEVLKRE